MVELVLVGGGKMGEALLRGLLAAGWDTARLAVVEVDPDRARYLGQSHPGLSVGAEFPAGGAASALVAVKPADVAGAARAAAGAGARRLLSIAAGVTTSQIEDSAPGVAVVRAMPNTPALVGEGASAVSAGASATAADTEWAASLLSAVGRVTVVPEHLLDAVTGLSGSGPAYVFLVAEALIDAGVAAGLPRDVSSTLTVQTLLGAARLLAEGQTPEALRAAVTSPGGTTAAALRVLEARAVRSAFIEAVAAGAERSRQLAGG